MDPSPVIAVCCAVLGTGLLGLGFWVWLLQRQKAALASLAVLPDKTGQPVLLLNANGAIVWANNASIHMLGCAWSDLAGRSLQEALLEKMPNPRIARHLQSGLSAGQPFAIDLLTCHKEGSRFWLGLHVTPVRNRDNAVTQYVVIGADVTPRKQFEEELVRVSRRNESLLEHVEEAICVLDSQGLINFVNPTAARLTGWAPAELNGQPLSALVHQLKPAPNSSEQKDFLWLGALQPGSIQVGTEDVFRRKDGSLFSVEYSSSPVRESVRESNSAQGAIVLFRDVTERRRAEVLRLRQEQHTAFRADIVFAMTGQDPLRLSLQKCAQLTVKHLQGEFARIWLLNAQGTVLELQAGAGTCTQIDGHQSVVPVGAGEVGIVARDKAPQRIDDLCLAPGVEDRDWIRREQLLCFIGYPLISEDKLIGVVAVYAKTRLPEGALSALGQAAECMARAIAQKITMEQTAEQAALLDKSQDAIVVMDLEHRVIFWNKSAERLYGWTYREVLGKPVQGFIYRDGSYFERARKETLEKSEWKGECCQVNKGDGTVIVDSQWTLIHDDSGKPKSILMVNTDVTERKKMEIQFLRTQRMESIGTLAGGIAHDLNNVLAPILMSSEMLKSKAKDEQSQRLLTMIETSAKRGADMVKQVLTFSRGMEGERLLLQTRHLIKEVVKIVGETFPKTIQIKTRLAENLWPIMGDATQLHQVLVNLVVNARDAMPNGGMLTMSAENTALEPGPNALPPGANPGFYVLIKVADTGTGIPPENLDKIFEPFFTTKEMGKGTGLGLATVLGIVKSHGGFLQVQTELKKGTTFLVYLPAMEGPQAQNNETEQKRVPTGHGEVILAVDDEAAVLTMTKEALENYGYRVLTARDGTEALATFSAHQSEIKGVLTDMLMPFMDGPSTIRVLKKLDPNVKVIAASGLMDVERVKDATGLDEIAFLMKPYTTEKLLQTVHQLLHETN